MDSTKEDEEYKKILYKEYVYGSNALSPLNEEQKNNYECWKKKILEQFSIVGSNSKILFTTVCFSNFNKKSWKEWMTYYNSPGTNAQPFVKITSTGQSLIMITNQDYVQYIKKEANLFVVYYSTLKGIERIIVIKKYNEHLKENVYTTLYGQDVRFSESSVTKEEPYSRLETVKLTSPRVHTLTHVYASVVTNRSVKGNYCVCPYHVMNALESFDQPEVLVESVVLPLLVGVIFNLATSESILLASIHGRNIIERVVNDYVSTLCTLQCGQILLIPFDTVDNEKVAYVVVQCAELYSFTLSKKQYTLSSVEACTVPLSKDMYCSAIVDGQSLNYCTNDAFIEKAFYLSSTLSYRYCTVSEYHRSAVEHSLQAHNIGPPRWFIDNKEFRQILYKNIDKPVAMEEWIHWLCTLRPLPHKSECKRPSNGALPGVLPGVYCFSQQNSFVRYRYHVDYGVWFAKDGAVLSPEEFYTWLKTSVVCFYVESNNTFPGRVHGVKSVFFDSIQLKPFTQLLEEYPCVSHWTVEEEKDTVIDYRTFFTILKNTTVEKLSIVLNVQLCTVLKRLYKHWYNFIETPNVLCKNSTKCHSLRIMFLYLTLYWTGIQLNDAIDIAHSMLKNYTLQDWVRIVLVHYHDFLQKNTNSLKEDERMLCVATYNKSMQYKNNSIVETSELVDL